MWDLVVGCAHGPVSEPISTSAGMYVPTHRPPYLSLRLYLTLYAIKSWLCVTSTHIIYIYTLKTSIYVYIHNYIHSYTPTHMYTHTYTHTVDTIIYTHVLYIYIRTHMYTHAYKYPFTYIYPHKCNICSFFN